MAFDDNMEVVLKMVNEVHNNHYDIQDFDMFLFPIFTGAHHFIVCYNIKKPCLEIIDNRVQTISIEETYGELLPRLENQKSVLHKLRVIYAHRMLTWSENKKRHIVLNNLVKFSMSKLHQK
ncbi:hypothetical protein DCAR_0520259 [Daucus carota subsp. sativus]|uniref:Uncharacterized protein n=1 Tax=Daucus carota subsp. sativus TaxID=79200 RepID=A0A175YA38_DAUCS|nr:hypothetical protein DCAR_0520259 [Daucus carota subsp. sativus]